MAPGDSRAVQRPNAPKNTNAHEKSAHWWNAMPIAMADQDGSTCSAQSRAGIAATDIQSTAASRPRRVAANWLISVE